MNTTDFQKKSLLGIFFRYFKRHWKLFALDMGCAIAISGVDLLFPIVTRSALYDLLPNHLYTTFFTIIAIMVGTYLIRAGLQYIVCYYGHTFGVRVETDIRADLFRHMQAMSHDFYDRNRTGQLMSRLTSDLFDLIELAHHGPEDMVTAIFTIFGAVVVMATIQWQLALVVGLMLPIFIGVVMYFRKSLADTSVGVKRKIGHINTEIEASLSGIRTAKAFGNEELENERFTKANATYRGAKKEQFKAMARFTSSMEFLLCTLNVVIIGYGGYLIMQGEMDYRDLITFTLYITAFVNPMRKIANFAELFSSGYAGLTRFVEIMRTEPTLKDKPGAPDLKNVKGRISVSHVDFSYNQDSEVLHNVSLEVSPGETIAVVGPSGGGKTTLCQLIPRFYDVTGGSISIDGQDVRDVTQRSIHQNIGIVQQDVFLFADTILENIRYGRPSATDEEVFEAAKKAELYEDILAMPHGFSTYVGERGTLLSGGQKQRVAIARIFLKNPPILILDEATSALDSVTEAKIQRAFDTLSQGRTTLIIAHRLSTIRSANRIISIADGVITECGSHQELLKKGGIYADLYFTQSANLFTENQNP